jgi:NADH-quinone oxidoreductase subunit E
MSVRRLYHEQPESFAFTPENLEWARGQIAKYPEGRQHSAVIPLLWRAQEQHGGWLPEPAIRYVADLLDMAPIRALEVATFYTMFNLAPVGRHYVQLCGTVPCAIQGADALKEVCRRVIGPERELSPDGALSWLEVECLGACVNAPMAQINADYYEDLTPERLEEILNDLRAGKEVRPGPQVDRQFSAPLGGPTTLTDPALYAREMAGEDRAEGGVAGDQAPTRAARPDRVVRGDETASDSPGERAQRGAEPAVKAGEPTHGTLAAERESFSGPKPETDKRES